MTRLDWWTGVILVIGCSFIGNGTVSGVWMHWSQDWWHYILPFCLGGTVGFVIWGLAAAGSRADAPRDVRQSSPERSEGATA